MGMKATVMTAGGAICGGVCVATGYGAPSAIPVAGASAELAGKIYDALFDKKPPSNSNFIIGGIYYEICKNN